MNNEIFICTNCRKGSHFTKTSIFEINLTEKGKETFKEVDCYRCDICGFTYEKKEIEKLLEDIVKSNFTNKGSIKIKGE